MNDQIPDFEDAPQTATEPPAPKKPRRKPNKKKAKRVSFLERKAQLGLFGKAKAKKRKAMKRRVAKRRGRPLGALGKPKATPAEGYVSSVATILSVHAQVESSLSRLSIAERKAMLELFK